MKKIQIYTKLVALLLITTALSGCMTVPYKVYDWQGKIYRGVVIMPAVVLRTKDGVTPEFAEKTGFRQPQDQNMRATRVRVKEGLSLAAVFRIGVFMIPDNVEFSDLGNGAIVDVVFEKGDSFNYPTARYNRVVRLVCSSNDKPCIDREFTTGEMARVIEANAADDDAKRFGNTYLRRMSDEEHDKYHN